MTALELAIRAYWRHSRAALAGNPDGVERLVQTAELWRTEVAALANAASNSLTACAMRSAR